MLPDDVAVELLTGLAAHRACGFHTARWAQHFSACCEAVLGEVPTTFVAPAAPDLADVIGVAGTDACAEHLAELDRQIGDRKFIARVDRIELSKNILRGFLAFDELLDTRPEWRGRVVFGASVYPSRATLADYAGYTNEVHGLIDRINARWSTDDWTPILVDADDNFPASVAVLRRYDVLLVNPVRDGLNLVAKEGVTVNERDGVLALSPRERRVRRARAVVDRAEPLRHLRDRRGAARRARHERGRARRPRRGPRARPRSVGRRTTGSATSSPPPIASRRGALRAAGATPRVRRRARRPARCSSAGASALRTPTRRTSAPSSACNRSRASKAGRSPRSSPRKHAARCPRDEVGDDRPLVHVDRRAQLERHAPRVDDEAGGVGGGVRPRPRPVEVLLTGADVEGDREPLALDVHTLRGGGIGVVGGLGDHRHERPGRLVAVGDAVLEPLDAVEARDEQRRRRAGVELEAVAEERDGATGHDRDPPVSMGEGVEGVHHAGEGDGPRRVVDDRRERAVEVGDDSGAARRVQERLEAGAVFGTHGRDGSGWGVCDVPGRGTYPRSGQTSIQATWLSVAARPIRSSVKEVVDQ